MMTLVVADARSFHIFGVGSRIMVQFFLKKLKDRLRLMDIDFTAPWWRVITRQRFYLMVTIIGESFFAMIKPLVVLAFGVVFSYERMDYFVLLFVVWLCSYCASVLARFSRSMLQMQALHSISYRSYQWFLQADPIFHTNRSSGTIVSKIHRAARSYDLLVDACSYELLQAIVGVITVIVSLSRYQWFLGFATSLMLAMIVFLNIFMSKHFIIPYEKRLIRADDKVRAIGLENLVQINFIRTCFATPFMQDRLKKVNKKAMRKQGGLRFFYCFFYLLIRLMYLASICVVALFIFDAVKGSVMQHAIGVALLLSYLRGTSAIIRVEKPLREMFKAITSIVDLFKYINEFGSQTFPVILAIPEKHRVNLLSSVQGINIEMESLLFDYPDDAKIFDSHNFRLSIDTSDKRSKLYGIIGPSGVGKSTFLLILGGQIRPKKGRVYVNDVDIYQVDDVGRRRLLGLQGQVSSGIRGNLRQNLLFGLPPQRKKTKNEKPTIYTDDYLISLLGKVGLWKLFNQRGGLDTFVGEGGLTLSGGQRQRLNFANLYLRVHYFQPPVILIDEPTSSLDELSEQAITEMIESFAQTSVTMVIAHRLNTVARARGLIDFSLIHEEKDIKAYRPEDLKERSSYYQQLLSGSISIED